MSGRVYGEYLSTARNFEDAARQLLSRSDLLQPALHLIAHGFELTFKSVLLHSGRTENEIRKRPFGHDLWSMWNQPELSFLHRKLQGITAGVTDTARVSGLYQHPLAFPAMEPAVAFLEQFQVLSKLHSSELDYRLRYPSGDNPKAPLPPFFGDVLRCLIDEVGTHQLSSTC